MEALVPYTIWAVLILTGLSLVAIVLFGIRNLTFGKVNPLTVVLSALPIVLMIVLGFAMGDWAHGAVLACLIALAVTAFTLLLSGMRGLIGF